MVVFSRVVFPFRTISFLAFYIILNTLLYSRNTVARKHIETSYAAGFLTSPTLPSNLGTIIVQNCEYLDEYKDYLAHIKGWIITADIFIVFLFCCLVFGFLTNYPYISIFIAFLHFIGIILCTHFALNYCSINFLICGVFFGIILPGLIEIHNIICLFAFKTDFYIPRT